jgi:hypothetical protein
MTLFALQTYDMMSIGVSKALRKLDVVEVDAAGIMDDSAPSGAT